MSVIKPPVNTASRECIRMRLANQIASIVHLELSKIELANQNVCYVLLGPIKMNMDNTSVRCVMLEHSSGRKVRTFVSTVLWVRPRI